MNDAIAVPIAIDFYIKYPLYEAVQYEEDEFEKGWELKYFEGSMDAYCPECKNHSIFEKRNRTTNYGENAWLYDHKFVVTFECSRNRKHELYFLFQVKKEERTVQKIGQWPSMASLNLFDVKKYSAALEKRYFEELTRAIGLAAHGIGVGSFVYLRRIFEFLIEEAHLKAKLESPWDEASFQQFRMTEKISALKKWLPEFLVENRAIYSILSKGIHELTEAECLAAYPSIRIGIEIILDAKLEKIRLDKKIEEATKAINVLSGKI
ncbi:short-chain dehydrogenase [Oxalicibacterium solurbis]|uniref:Uncharacterized protein n=1 Tax=Oxalicibacterium solurbis TaxID=69280 RepID=A0A8J3F6C4_9BURK|nr:short-chain dehydrogenase [Oxalicibacterium solurbis]GGI54904.1 hypothetical protein GCM10011430_20780 [Oxalicibacterium solurbis]